MKIIYIGHAFSLMEINKKFNFYSNYGFDKLLIMSSRETKEFNIDIEDADYVMFDLITLSHNNLDINKIIGFLKSQIPLGKLILHEMYFYRNLVSEELLSINYNFRLIDRYRTVLNAFSSDINRISIGQVQNEADYIKAFKCELDTNYEKKQEYFKIDLWHEDFIRKTFNSSMEFTGGHSVIFKTDVELDWHQIAFWSNFIHPISNKNYKRLPSISSNVEYECEPIFSNNDFEVRIIINFYNKRDKICATKKLFADNWSFTTPRMFSYYRIGMRLKGKGECEFEYLRIRRNRNNGLVLSNDKTAYFEDSDPITYYFKEKTNSNKLIVIFSGVKVIGPRFEFLSSLESISAHRLYILDDYSLAGSYYLDKEKKQNLQTNIISIIKRYAEEYDIKSDNIIMLGNSKGGFAALFYGLRMEVGHILSSGPTLQLGTRLSRDSKWTSSALSYIVNKPTLENLNYLNELLLNEINNSIKIPKLNFLLVEKDEYVTEYFPDFKDILDKNLINYKITIKEGNQHKDLLKHVVQWTLDYFSNIEYSNSNNVIQGNYNDGEMTIKEFGVEVNV